MLLSTSVEIICLSAVILIRPRVLLVSEKDTPRPTLLAEDVARFLSTDKSTLALPVDFLLPRPEAVSFVICRCSIA